MNGIVFLLGYMASGKTTLGQALHAHTSAAFIDLDQYIEQCTHRTVSEIFATEGEQAFRRHESNALAQIVDNKQNTTIIVACGGGTPCFNGNMELMNAHGTTVWLRPDTEAIMRRLRLARQSRPLVARFSDDAELEDFVTESLRAREQYYSKANLTFDSSRLESEQQIAQSVNQFINLITQHHQ